jgi:LysM repeat protein
MDTISRESSPSYLPIAGLVVGCVGLLLGGIALANASKANTAAAAAADQAASQVTRIDDVDSRLSSAASTADRAASNIASLQRSTQDAFTAVAGEMGKINGEIAKLQEAATRAPQRSAGAAAAGPVVAGPGEYVVKGGDTGYKIATANGVSIADLQAVNPGVNWNSLKVGQKLKLPAKK